MQEFDPLVTFASLLSVFIVFLINRWLGGYTPAHLGSDADALDRLRQDFPSFDLTATVVGCDGKSAVLAGGIGSDSGSVALVEAVGDRFLTRLLRPGDIKALFLEPGTAGKDEDSGQRQQMKLRLQLNDFTNSAFEIDLPTGTNGTLWHQRLSEFHSQPDTPEGASDAPEGNSNE